MLRSNPLLYTLLSRLAQETGERKRPLRFFGVHPWRASFVSCALGQGSQTLSSTTRAVYPLDLAGSEDRRLPEPSAFSPHLWRNLTMVFRCNTLPLPPPPCSDQKCHSFAKCSPRGALEQTSAPAVAPTAQPASGAAALPADAPHGVSPSALRWSVLGGLQGRGRTAHLPGSSWRLPHESWRCLCWKRGVICASWLVSCHSKQ